MSFPPVRIAMSSSNSFASVAKARCFHCANFKTCAETIDNESCKASPSTSSAMMRRGFPVSATACKNRDQLFNASDLLLIDENIGIFKDALLRFRIGHEVGREIAAVKVHPFNNIESCLKAFCFFNSDCAIFAHFFHRCGDDFADFSVVIGRDGSNLSDLLLVFHFFASSF